MILIALNVLLARDDVGLKSPSTVPENQRVMSKNKHDSNIEDVEHWRSGRASCIPAVFERQELENCGAHGLRTPARNRAEF